MTVFTDAQHRAPAVYAMPESAHLALVEMSYHLKLMTALTECASPASDQRHRPVAFAWWFAQMERDVDRIIAASSVCIEPSLVERASGDIPAEIERAVRDVLAPLSESIQFAAIHVPPASHVVCPSPDVSVLVVTTDASLAAFYAALSLVEETTRLRIEAVLYSPSDFLCAMARGERELTSALDGPHRVLFGSERNVRMEQAAA